MSSDDQSPKTLSDAGLDRRQFLRYVGAGASTLFGATAMGGALSQLACATAPSGIPDSSASPALVGWVRADGSASWRPPLYPVPLPGDPEDRALDGQRFARYEVKDELVLPEGFRYEVMAQYGDTFGPADNADQQIDFGYNNDYTGLLRITGTDDHYWLFVNHEYISFRPFAESYQEIYGDKPPILELKLDTNDPVVWKRGVLSVDGWTVPNGNWLDLATLNATAENDNAIPSKIARSIDTLAKRMLTQLGVSVLRIKRLSDGRFEVVGNAADHRRINGFARQNVGDAPSLWTGPASYLMQTPPRGTLANCSGGTTPWGTFLTCEENFYIDTHEDITPTGEPIISARTSWGARSEKINNTYVFDNPTPSSVSGNGLVLDPPLDGREYGWVSEIDPTTGSLTKHTALGRFRHENVTLRCEPGKRLAAYMGDDRRGGHVWKFVSDGVVEDPGDAKTQRLLEKGTLHVARFRDDFSGEWVPLVAGTPLRRPEPEHCFSQHIQVPSRVKAGSVSVGDPEHDDADIKVEAWVETVETFTGKKFADCALGDLVKAPEGVEDNVEKRNGILLMDAFLMANACGGTPTARPEDLEVHPKDRTVYIAFTDATDSSDGSPDQRIFPDSAMKNSRQYGAIYRIIEGGDETANSDPAARTFTWGKFISSGEVAEHGGGFACADNMAFDPDGNMWMVTDITTSSQNFPTQREAVDGSAAGGKTFPGVFGNNAMFMIPTHGPNAGVPQLFAIAPVEAEFCGPTFTEDGKTLILSVQHPGEVGGTRRSQNPSEVERFVVHDRDNRPFEQQRTLPIGSNFPHGELDRAPRPCVVCITRES